MIAVFHNQTIMTEPFLTGVENHAMDLVAYTNISIPMNALRLMQVKWWESTLVTVVNREPVEGFRSSKTGDVFLRDGVPMMVVDDGFRVMDPERWKDRKPSTMAELIHRHAPFRATHEMVLSLWEYVVEEYQLAFPDQVSDEIFFRWREENKKKFPTLLEH